MTNRRFKLTPEEARAEWVKDLRSGEFKQGKNFLKCNDGARCCLGVAVATFCRFEDREEAPRELGGHIYLVGSELLQDVQEWLGLMGPRGDNMGASLALRNDQGQTFSQIADIIESRPEGLFVED